MRAIRTSGNNSFKGFISELPECLFGPSSFGRSFGYLSSSLSRQDLSPSWSALETSELPQGNRSGVFLRLLGTLGKLDYTVNDILRHLVNVFACALMHEVNIALGRIPVNLVYSSK
jgi:hypothetical protein